MSNPSATEQLIAAIERERYYQSAVLESIPNSQAVPKYGVRNVVNIVLGAALLVVVALVWGVVHEL